MGDADLIAQSFSDPERFGGIFERHFEPIHGYLSRRLGAAIADDLAAQVFLIAFERRRTFDLAAPDARPWLYGIASNLVRGNRRAERRLLAALGKLAGQAETPGAELGEGLADPAEAAALAKALRRLDRDQREVLLLHCWAGLSHAEIAAALGVPAGTVASRLSRARQRVRADLDPDAVGTDRPVAGWAAKEER